MANKPAFAQGAQVEHPKFGLGSVMSCNEDYIAIKPDDHGEKKFCSLQIVLPNLKKKRPDASRRKTAQLQEKRPCRRSLTRIPIRANDPCLRMVELTSF